MIIKQYLIGALIFVIGYIVGYIRSYRKYRLSVQDKIDLKMSKLP